MWLAGFFTYLFLVRLSPPSALLGSIFYMFSGALVWWIQKEEFMNTAMLIPVYLWAIERAVTSRSARDLALLGLSTGLVLLAGQPEMALYVGLLGAAYALFRLRLLPVSTGERLWRLLKVGGASLLGMGLAAPLLLLLYELVRNGFTLHPLGGTMGVQDPTPRSWVIALFVPTFFDYPIPERITPMNGVWDYVGGYTGVLAPVLALAGLVRRGPHRPFLLFFLLAGTVVLLKNFGVKPFLWMGYLPLLDQVWSNRWAAPVWNFSLAVAGALGASGLFRGVPHEEKEQSPSFNRLVYPSETALILAMAVLVLFLGLSIQGGWDLYRRVVSAHWLAGAGLISPMEKGYLFPAVVGGILVATATLLTAFWLINARSSLPGWRVALLTLALLELWFPIPRGYDALFLTLKLLPMALGFLALWPLALARWRWAALLLSLAFVSTIGLDLASPHGFPQRQDPFRPAPYIEFLKENAGLSRIMATDGVLMPNAASALGLHDVRYANWVSVRWYRSYSGHMVGRPFTSSDLVSSSRGDTVTLFFTGNPVDDLVLPPRQTFAPTVIEQLPYYSFLGVKYVVTPQQVRLDSLPLVYEKEVNIYENPHAFPRAYIAYRWEVEPSFEVAQALMGKPDLSPSSPVYVEEEPKGLTALSSPPAYSAARIVEYQPHRVVVQVVPEATGLLVLTDTYYPGWKAEVDGQERRIYRVNGVARGVIVGPEDHQVAFVYSPRSFWVGTGILSLGALGLLLQGAVPWSRVRSLLKGRYYKE